MAQIILLVEVSAMSAFTKSVLFLSMFTVLSWNSSVLGEIVSIRNTLSLKTMILDNMFSNLTKPFNGNSIPAFLLTHYSFVLFNPSVLMMYTLKRGMKVSANCVLGMLKKMDSVDKILKVYISKFIVEITFAKTN